MEDIQHYVRVWELILTHLAGWSEPRVRDFVQRWAPQLADDESMMYHELPTYYVAGILIPSDLNPRTCEYWPLLSNVMCAIGNPPSDGEYDWAAARSRVDAVIAEERRRGSAQ